MNDFDLSYRDKKRMAFETDASIRQADGNAHEAWRAMALKCVRDVARVKEKFTVNDVRDLVKMSLLKTHDNRAMGGVMKAAQREGLISPTGESIPSIVGHKVHIQIWKSNIHIPEKQPTLI